MFHIPFADVLKIGVLKNFAILTITGKHPCSSLFLIKLQKFKPETFLEKDSSTGVLMRIVRNFYQELFLQNICRGNLYFNYLLIYYLQFQHILLYTRSNTHDLMLSIFPK